MDVRVVEGISGVWHYHLAKAEGPFYEALCGARTMYSAAPLDSWGYKPDHMPASYCAECARIAGIKESQP